MGKDDLVKEYRNLLDRDIEDFSIGLKNTRTKRRMLEIENLLR